MTIINDNSSGGQQYADGTVQSVDEFTDLVKFILDAAWGPDWGEFTIEYPTGTDPDNIPLPIITYELVRRRPSESIPALKPKPMQIIPDPDVPGHTITIYRQWFDCYIDFSFWHKTHREAEDLKNRFEDMMLAYAGYFKQKGVSEILFHEEGPEDISVKWRQDIPHRVLRYFIRLERVTTVRSVVINNITTVVDVALNGTPATPVSETVFVDPPSKGTDPFLLLYEHYYPSKYEGGN
jgi:hypothetical protein